MSQSCSSSSDTSSAKYEFSDSDADHKRRGNTSRPRRLPTSNSKNAVAARINRMKQKKYVKDLEKKMLRLKCEMRMVKQDLKDREKMCASSRRQVAYLRSMITNSEQIGGLLRNIRWRNVIPQEEKKSCHMMFPPAGSRDFEGWRLLDGINPPTSQLFQESIPSKYVSVCMLLP